MPKFVDTTKLTDVNKFIVALRAMEPGQAIVFRPLPSEITEMNSDVDLVRREIDRLASAGSLMLFNRHVGRQVYQLEAHACRPRTKQILEALGDAACAFVMANKRFPRPVELKMARA